jgi:RNA polymerase sigma-70 factor (ECF subfamily)
VKTGGVRCGPAAAGGADGRTTVENRTALPFVWTATMRTIALTRPGRELEGTLDRKAGEADEEVREQFLRVASGELDRAYRLAGLLLGDGRDAEDATQEALLRAWTGLASLRDPATFQPWFDRILVNLCRDRLRRRSKVRFLPLDAGAAAMTADPFRDLLARDEALRALDGLDADERTVLVLHFWADLPLADVAERTGWPIGTVKSRLHRALRKAGDRLAQPPAGAER